MNLQFLTTISPAKIAVHFFHALSGDLIGKQKIPVEQLPLVFDKPTMIDWKDIRWRILRSVPTHAKDYLVEKKLVLHVVENTALHKLDLGYDIATICGAPPVLDDQPLFNEFVMDIERDEWRQLEFFHVSCLEKVQQEMIKVESLLYPGKEFDTLAGYKEQVIRMQTPWQLPGIEWQQFYDMLNQPLKGACRFDGKGYLENGIALRSAGFSYYGILKEGQVCELYLHHFESVDDEFYTVASAFGLALADWRNAKIILL